MALTIRCEQVRDYAAIAAINALAFGRMDEAVLVDVLRHSPRFDPTLSLVAEAEGRIVGHALFVIYDLLIGGRACRAGELAPLAVNPDWQRRGVGGALLAEGHRRLREAGCALALLLGHDTYYPRHGYRTRMFGQAQVRVRRALASATSLTLTPRDVRPQDIPALQALWRTWFADVDLARLPGDAITDWMSTRVAARNLVFEADGQILAYARFSQGRAHQPGLALARDRAATTALLSWLGAEAGQESGAGADGAWLTLPWHPRSAAVRSFVEPPYEEALQTWSAGMIRILNERDPAVVAYVEEVAAGTRAPGIAQEPPEFDLFL